MRSFLSIAFVLLFCLPTTTLSAQYLSGIATRWNDDFSEWLIFPENEEEEEGYLRMRWQSQRDWTVWEYRLGEETGAIKLKWKQDPNQWEIRGNNQIVTARSLWNNNFLEWRISTRSEQFTLKCRYGNVIDEWEIRDSKSGAFRLYTNWEGDPREWTIEDDLNESVSLTTKMAIIFLVVYHSSPKD